MSEYCYNCMEPLTGEGNCPKCGSDGNISVPAHHLLPGTLLNGKFCVGRALGEGGFGITYIGRDVKLDMKVAIKEYYPNGYVNRSNTISSQVNDSVTEGRKDFFEKGRERFLREAQILAKFSGEAGVVDVRDFFEENNTAYIIMEYLDGVDLKNYLKQNGVMRAERVVELLTPVMLSLKKVHARGLIHRDISPDNIMIVGDKVKLLDFGAARTVSAEANKSLSVMLKPGYAPEEQYRSKGKQGPWTDIYALCATMYKCITGRTPDDATQRVFSDEVKAPSALGIAIAPEIECAIMRGMSVNQNDRYQTIDDLIRGLQGIEVEFSDVEKTVAVARAPLSAGAASAASAASAPRAEVRTEPRTEPRTAPRTEPRTAQTAPITQTPTSAPARTAAPAVEDDFDRTVAQRRPAAGYAPQEDAVRSDEPKKKKGKGALIAVLVVVILALIGGAVFAVLNFFGKDEEAEKAEQEEATIAEAQELIDSGEYSEAYKLLKGIEDNENAKKMLGNFRTVPVKHVETKDGNITETAFKYGSNNLPIECISMKNAIEDEKFNFEYDSNGRLVRVLVSEDGETDTYEYTYDANGNKTKEVRTYSDGSASTSEYTYDVNGNVTKEVYTGSGGYTSTYEYEYTYDANGNKTKTAYTDSDGDTTTTEYTYDANGNVTKEVFTNLYGDTYTREYTYDANGNVTKYVYTNPYGSTSTDEYTYDANGNMTKAVYTGSYGSVSTTEYVNTYDENGFLKEKKTISGENSTETVEYKFVYIPYELDEQIEKFLEDFN